MRSKTSSGGSITPGSQSLTSTSAHPERLIRCRYRRRNDEMCPNPALDQSDDALIYICMKHGARVVKMVMDRQRELQGRSRRG